MAIDTVHVVYIITKLELGGAQKVCLALARHMESSTLIAGAGGILDGDVAHNDTVCLLPMLKRELSLRGIFAELHAFVKLVSILRQLRKKHARIIVHTHSTKAGIMGRWAALFAGITHRVHTIHGYAFHAHQSYLRWLPIYCIELVTSLITSRFICVSSYDQMVGKRLFPRFMKKQLLIRAAIEWHAGGERLQPVDHCIVGTIACFKPQKNIFDLLRAFYWVAQRNPHVRCEIIGDGILRADIEQWIMAHNLTDRITLHGWQHDVIPIMQRWHLFALTSLWEGLPCAIVEARMLKIPVFAYDTGGISDVIISGRNGMLYPQGAWRELAQDLYRLSRDPHWHHQLASYGDDLSDFHQMRMVEQHRTLYSRLAGSNTPC